MFDFSWFTPYVDDDIVLAAKTCAKYHEGQFRKNSKYEPYAYHPTAMVYEIVKFINDNISQRIEYNLYKSILISAYLHDTLEDTDISENEISDNFGVFVLNIVKDLTNDKCILKSEKKEKQILKMKSISDEAKFIKIFDKISNIGDLASYPPIDWNSDKCLEYLEHSKLVVDNISFDNSFIDKYKIDPNMVKDKYYLLYESIKEQLLKNK